MKIKTQYQVLFIIFVTLAVYYISINSTINSIDDKKMFNWLLNLNGIDLKHIFFPHSGGYYRPVSILTFQIDRVLWLLNGSFYHLENILIHTINAVLVFFLALKLFGDRYRYIPLFSALLFAVYPINTEAVNWISARCDLLATFFVLLGFLVFLHGKKRKNRILWFILAAFIGFFGALSKEVGVAFYPAIIFWIIFIEKDIPKKKIGYSFIFVLFLVFYFYLRYIALINSDISLSRVVASVSHHSYFNDLLIFIQALGFYVKKLIVPFPLNFGIIHISKLYLYVGILVILISLFFLYERSKLTGLFLICILFVSPAFFVALGHVAWTPYAERYVYTASAFFAIFSVVVIHKIFKYNHRLFNGILIALIVFSAAATFDRNRVWSSNLSLYKDTVKKSPDFVIARNEYANALLLNGKKEEAMKQYKIASSFAKNRLDTLPSLNLTETSSLPPLKKKEKFYDAYNKLPRLNNIILGQIIKTNFSMMSDAKDKNKLLEENAELFEKLYNNTHNGFYLYKTAQMYLASKDYKMAEEYLTKTKQHLSKNSIYFKAADKLLQKLP